MKKNINKPLSIDEACDYLGYTKSYVYKLTSSGVLPYSKPNGKKIFFDPGELNNWMMSRPIGKGLKKHCKKLK